MRQQPSRRAASAGTSMIEVLITVVILAFGLIGLAGLLLQGFGLNNASYLRSVAAQQAYDMGDRTGQMLLVQQQVTTTALPTQRIKTAGLVQIVP